MKNRFKHGASRTAAGFSLAEMMVVVVILGLLATLVVPNVIQRLNVAQRTKAETEASTIAKALDEFAILNGGRYPDSLDALVTPDEGGHTLLDQRTLPVDPWGNEYVYAPPSGGTPRPIVLSYGKDGSPGGEGDAADIVSSR